MGNQLYIVKLLISKSATAKSMHLKLHNEMHTIENLESKRLNLFYDNNFYKVITQELLLEFYSS